MTEENHEKMDLREVGCDPGEWIDLAEDRDQWRAYVRTVMNLRVPWKLITVLQSRESPRRMRRSGEFLWMNGDFIRSHTWVHAFPLADFEGKTITLIQTRLYYPCYKIRSRNEILLISRPLVFMINKSCRVRCLTYVRSIGVSPCDISEEPVT